MEHSQAHILYDSLYEIDLTPEHGIFSKMDPRWIDRRVGLAMRAPTAPFRIFAANFQVTIAERTQPDPNRGAVVCRVG